MFRPLSSVSAIAHAGLRSRTILAGVATLTIAGLAWGVLPAEPASAEPLNYTTRRSYRTPTQPCLSQNTRTSSRTLTDYSHYRNFGHVPQQSTCATYPSRTYSNRNRSIRNSILINPTVINSPIRDSVLVNPTIVTPRQRVYSIPTRSRTVYYYPY